MKHRNVCGRNGLEEQHVTFHDSHAALAQWSLDVKYNLVSRPHNKRARCTLPVKYLLYGCDNENNNRAAWRNGRRITARGHAGIAAIAIDIATGTAQDCMYCTGS